MLGQVNSDDVSWLQTQNTIGRDHRQSQFERTVKMRDNTDARNDGHILPNPQRLARLLILMSSPLIQSRSINTGDPRCCPVCGSKFSLPKDARRHVNSVHHRKKYPCEVCNTEISRPDLLKRHIDKMHNDSSPNKT